MPTKKMDAKRAAKARRLEIEAAKRAARAAERRRSWLWAGSALLVGVLLVLAVEIPRWTAPTPIAQRSLSALGVSV
jgi:cytochrome c-type biogenesis protein CcmH/NrfG